MPKLSKHLMDLRGEAASTRNKEIERLRTNWRQDREDKAKSLLNGAPPDLSQISGTVLSWTGLLEVARQYTDERGGGWIFRGQSFPYPLLPKIGRKDARKDPTTNTPLPHDAYDERWIVDEFKRRARPYLTHMPEGDLEWLAIAQHHGMPTRLLDWTESFLVAVYFAIEKAGVDGPATIYASRGEKLLRSSDDSFTIRKVGLYRPPHITARIPAQQGIFTVHPKPTTKYHPRALEQWVIDKKACYNIKKQLLGCGVNRSVLYPDIDGLANYLEWLYKRPTSSRRVGRDSRR